MLEKIITIAIEAGKILMKSRKEGFQIKTKKDSYDFVTSADIKSEEFITSRLKEEFPEDSILSEEEGQIIGKRSSRIWMVDPLDGTKDFKNNGSGFSVMIGLCYEGKPVLGVVYAPAKKLLYYAQKGKGAYVVLDKKEHKLRVGQIRSLEEARMVTRIIGGEKREEDNLVDFFEIKEKIPESSVGIKLGLIAENKADFHISSNARASKWDTCAPQIILEEAGGKITDLYGKSLNYNQADTLWKVSFVASNKIIHNKVIAKIKEFYSDKRID